VEEEVEEAVEEEGWVEAALVEGEEEDG